MVAPVLVVLDLVDDAPVQCLGLIELAAFDEVPSKVVPLGLADLGLKFIGAGTGEGRRQLAARSALLLSSDGGVVFEGTIDPLFASFVEDAMGLAFFSLLLLTMRARTSIDVWLLISDSITIGWRLIEQNGIRVGNSIMVIRGWHSQHWLGRR